MTEILKARLKAVNSNALTKKLSMDEEETLFEQEYLKMKGNSHKCGNSFDVIPQFHKVLPGEEDVLQQKLRAQFLQRKSKLLLDNAELKELWVILDSHTSGAPVGEDQMMDWDQYCVVRSLVSDKCREYFKSQA